MVVGVLGYYLKIERHIAEFCISYSKEHSTGSDRPIRVKVTTLYLGREKKEREICAATSYLAIWSKFWKERG